jgi:uncharacterized metal-binding protein YceD (DUF177 family)
MARDRNKSTEPAAPLPEPGPLSRLIDAERLPKHGTDITVTANAEEMATLAETLDIPAIHALEGVFSVEGSGKRASVKGIVRARVSQICGVTLDAFETDIEEEVDLDFAAAQRRKLTPEEEEQRRIDPPDEIINGKIDLGRVTAEFLALGLDPFPRKPGAVFEEPAPSEPRENPFGALAGLKPDDAGTKG